MVFLQRERLPYGIISAGTISHFFPYHEICVGGDLPYRGNFTIWYCFPPGEVLPLDFFRGKVCHMVFLQGGRLPYGIISGGGGLGGRIPM